MPPAYIHRGALCVPGGSDTGDAPFDATGVHRGALCVPRHAPWGVASSPGHHCACEPVPAAPRPTALAQVGGVGGKGWCVPQGTTVLVSPYLLHRDPQQWPRQEVEERQGPLGVHACMNREDWDEEWRVPQLTAVLMSPCLLPRNPQHWPM
ncbi:unnamed protein product [Closterium sp. NIES-54]